MRSLIVLSVAASTLVLAACNRETETAPPTDGAAMGAAAASADSVGSDAATSAPGGDAGGGAQTADRLSETMDPAGSASARPTDTMGPVTQERRDGAKMAAEETNLHPKPPTN